MTKAQAYKIVEEKFGGLTNDGDHQTSIFGLCDTCPNELIDDFKGYWKKINTKNYGFISGLFGMYTDIEDRRSMVSIARLIILFHFIEDTYK